MKVTCPKCGQSGEFGFFNEADESGVIGMVRHNPIEVRIPFLGTPFIKYKDWCMITENSLKKTDWYAKFLSDRNEELKKHQEESTKKFESQYWKSVTEEDDTK